MQHLLQVGDEPVQVDHLRLHDLPTAEGKELLGETRRADPGLLDLVQIFLEHVLVPEIEPGIIAVADDRREEIVEVVSHPTGEPPDRLHLLRLVELLEQTRALRDVARHTVHLALARRAGIRGEMQLEDDLPAAGERRLHLHLPVNASRPVQKLPKKPGGPVLVLGRHEIGHLPSHEIRDRGADHRLEPRAYKREAPMLFQREDHVIHALGHEPVLPLGFHKLRAARLEAFHHGIEGVREVRDLLSTLDADPVVEVAAADRPRSLQEVDEGQRQRPAHEYSQRE